MILHIDNTDLLFFQCIFPAINQFEVKFKSSVFYVKNQEIMFIAKNLKGEGREKRKSDFLKMTIFQEYTPLVCVSNFTLFSSGSM